MCQLSDKIKKKEEMETDRFFITTPIYYINDAPHIGHAYTTLAADILVRYWKKRKVKVFFLTGADEHGLKVAQAASRLGVSPKKFADEMANKYQAAWSFLNIQYDNFIRTTNQSHERMVKDFVQKLYDNGEIFKDKYEGLYCVGCEEYKVEKDLDEGDVCPVHKKKCEMISEDIYFFKLSKFQKQLIEVIEKKQIEIDPQERKNEILSFLKKEPLRDLAISRSKVNWGIPVPWDKSQTIYVWVDALLNYITGSRGYWPPTLQLIGKDILRFHCVIWPAMLLAAGIELPRKIFIHGFFTINGEKMSKSIGNVIDPVEITKAYGVDSLRYFLFREIPFGGDGDFSIDRFKKRYQSDLANDLGNLVQRTLVMAKKYKISWHHKDSTKVYPKKIIEAMEKLQFSITLELIWEIITEANRKIDKERPWDLAKTNPQKNRKLIESLLCTISEINDLIEPFMPNISRQIIEQLTTGDIKPLFPKIK